MFSARIMDADGSLLKRRRINLLSSETSSQYYIDTYGEGAVNSDQYYRENAVLGDLPAGKYTIWIDDDGMINKTEIEIMPGEVTTVKYWGHFGFDHTPPSAVRSNFIPPDAADATTLDK